MLKLLRRKFIAVSMASMGAVLALIITIMNVSNYFSMRDTVSQRMNIAQDVLKDGGFKREGIGNPDELIIRGGGKQDNARKDREWIDNPESAVSGGQRGPMMPDDFGGGFGKVNMETRIDIRYFSAVFDAQGAFEEAFYEVSPCAKEYHREA